MITKRFIFGLLHLLLLTSAEAVTAIKLTKERSLVLGFIANKVRNYPKTTVGDRPAYTVVYSTPNYMNYNAYIQSRTGTAIVNTSTSAPATAGSRAPANADSAHSAKSEEASAK